VTFHLKRRVLPSLRLLTKKPASYARYVHVDSLLRMFAFSVYGIVLDTDIGAVAVGPAAGADAADGDHGISATVLTSVGTTTEMTPPCEKHHNATARPPTRAHLFGSCLASRAHALGHLGVVAEILQCVLALRARVAEHLAAVAAVMTTLEQCELDAALVAVGRSVILLRTPRISDVRGMHHHTCQGARKLHSCGTLAIGGSAGICAANRNCGARIDVLITTCRLVACVTSHGHHQIARSRACTHTRGIAISRSKLYSLRTKRPDTDVGGALIGTCARNRSHL
jgi:hypothetical protein